MDINEFQVLGRIAKSPKVLEGRLVVVTLAVNLPNKPATFLPVSFGGSAGSYLAEHAEIGDTVLVRGCMRDDPQGGRIFLHSTSFRLFPRVEVEQEDGTVTVVPGVEAKVVNG